MEKLIVSSLLTQKQVFYSEFTKVLREKNIELIQLSETRDIWCRDFMPVKSSSRANLLFNYDPSYLKGKWQDKLTPRINIIRMLNELGMPFIPVDDIKLEGGNVIRSENLVIMTDGVYRENDIKDDKLGQRKIISKLEKHFESEILVIPHQPYDLLSHSDGMVRFLDNKTVLINDYSSVEVPTLKESKHILDNFFGALGKSGLNILQIPYAPIDKKGEDDMPVAVGIYLNYLETNSFILLPLFGDDHKEQDAAALEKFKTIFKSINKEVIAIDSRTIAMGGGVLNCITWN